MTKNAPTPTRTFLCNQDDDIWTYDARRGISFPEQLTDSIYSASSVKYLLGASHVQGRGRKEDRESDMVRFWHPGPFPQEKDPCRFVSGISGQIGTSQELMLENLGAQTKKYLQAFLWNTLRQPDFSDNGFRLNSMPAVAPLLALELVRPEWHQRIKHIMGLKPGWDGYGAVQVTPQAIQQCVHILLQAAKLESTRGRQKLFIAPLPNGGLELEWDFNIPNDFMVEIPPVGEPINYLLTLVDPAGNEKEEEGVLTGENLVALFGATSL